MFSFGLGFDQGGIVELVHLPEQPQMLQPNLPPRPAPPVAERPATTPEPAVEPTPAQQPVPQPEPTPPTSQPQPEPEPKPQPEPQPEPEPVRQPEPEPEAGQEDVLVSEAAQADVVAGTAVEREKVPQQALPSLPEPQAQPKPEPTPASGSEAETERVGEPSDGVDDGDGEGDIDSDLDGGEGDEPASAPPVSVIAGAALGSGKSLDDVGETDVLSDLIVELHIDPDGRVTAVNVVSGSGVEEVDDSIVNQMSRWVAESGPGRDIVEVWRVSFELHALGSTSRWQPVPELIEVR